MPSNERFLSPRLPGRHRSIPNRKTGLRAPKRNPPCSRPEPALSFRNGRPSCAIRSTPRRKESPCRNGRKSGYPAAPDGTRYAGNQDERDRRSYPPPAGRTTRASRRTSDDCGNSRRSTAPRSSWRPARSTSRSSGSRACSSPRRPTRSGRCRRAPRAGTGCRNMPVSRWPPLRQDVLPARMRRSRGRDRLGRARRCTERENVAPDRPRRTPCARSS